MNRAITQRNRARRVLALYRKITSGVNVVHALEQRHDRTPSDKRRQTLAAHATARAAQDLAAVLRRPVKG